MASYDTARETRVPVKGVRKATAAAMVGSAFTAPHVTEFVTIDVTRTLKLVEELKRDKEMQGLRVNPLLVIAKALLTAVKRHPEINASWDEAAQEIVVKHYVNLGIAAATPRGLLVPNIKDAHAQTLPQLAQSLGDLVSTAREGKTSPAAMQGGTVTITNVGVFGVDTGTPILNPGESAILAVGAIRLQPWVHKGKVKPRQVTTLALSFDHRLVDGELGSKVLADVAAILEQPKKLITWGCSGTARRREPRPGHTGRGSPSSSRPGTGCRPQAGTCTVSTLLATSRSRSRRAARLRRRRIWLTPRACRTKTKEKAIV